MLMAVVQHNPQDDLEKSFSELRENILKAADAGSDLIATPEYYAYMGNSPKDLGKSGVWFEEINGRMSEISKSIGRPIHAGSIAEKRSDGVYNTTVVHDGNGGEIARYSKIHMFDIDLPDGTIFRESDIITPGTDVVTYDINGWRFGCSICYDIRFPELYRKLRDQGAEVLMVPSAFTLETGRAHWEVLLRARAIESGCYVAAPAQFGAYGNGAYSNFGHSLICDPWGQIIANTSDQAGFALGVIKKEYLNLVRNRVPVHRHHVLA
jgi:nitrilase